MRYVHSKSHWCGITIVSNKIKFRSIVQILLKTRKILKIVSDSNLLIRNYILTPQLSCWINKLVSSKSKSLYIFMKIYNFYLIRNGGFLVSTIIINTLSYLLLALKKDESRKLSNEKIFTTFYRDTERLLNSKILWN